MRASVLEGDPRARDEVLDRARDKHLARLGPGGNAGAGVDGDPRHLPVQQLTLACVETRAHLQLQRVHVLDDRLRAPDRPRRPIEAREEPVAGGVDLTSPEPDELPPYQLVVTLQELVPSTISQHCRPLGRTDDVGEEDGREHPFRLRLLPAAGFPHTLQEVL